MIWNRVAEAEKRKYIQRAKGFGIQFQGPSTA